MRSGFVAVAGRPEGAAKHGRGGVAVAVLELGFGVAEDAGDGVAAQLGAGVVEHAEQ